MVKGKRGRPPASRTPPAKVATVIIVPVEEVSWLKQLGQRVSAYYAGPQERIEVAMTPSTEEVIKKMRRHKKKRVKSS